MGLLGGRAPPAALPSVAAAPLYLDLRSREGGRLGVGCAVFGPRGACCGSSRRCDMPPVPRCASALPPGGGLLVAGFAECEDMPPAPAALPPGVGRSRGFFNVGVLRQSASRTAVRFTRAPDANLTAQILAKKPTKLGGQRRRHGGLVLAFCSTQRAKRQPTTQRQVCPPPETAGRDTGGPRTSDSEGRGGCEGRGGRAA